MHREPMQFVRSVKAQAPEFFTGKRVLEVGSLDINGSVRPLFTDCQYTGIDLDEGRGVDVVAHVTDYHRLDDGEFDVIISTETLEHDRAWDKSLAAMYRLLKPNGLMVVTAAAPNRPEHGTTRLEGIASPFTLDHYRNISVEDIASTLPANLFSKSYLGYRNTMDDLYFVGIKKESFPFKHVPAEKEIEDWHKQIDKFDKDRAYLVSGEMQKRNLTVTAEIATRGRYETTLPMAISAVLNQTRKPEKLVIYNDGELQGLETVEPFVSLLRMAIDNLGIQWTVYATGQKGQVYCHQHALDDAQTDLIWRTDDDEIPEPNCLENLLAEMKDGVGAVGGLVHHPGEIVALPNFVDGSLGDVTRGTNLSWYSWNGGPRETEHLYSTFLYRVESARKAGGYCKALSAAGHREETMFSHSIKRAGYSLVVTPNAKTWHLRQPSGGIRTFTDTSLWERDEVIFQEYLRTVGHVKEDQHLCILDSGLGDHLLFRGLLVDEFMRKHPDKKWLIACCYPEVLDNIPNVTIISIAEAKLIVGDKYSSYSLFEYGWHHGNGRHVLDVMREFYGERLETCA